MKKLLKLYQLNIILKFGERYFVFLYACIISLVIIILSPLTIIEIVLLVLSIIILGFFFFPYILGSTNGFLVLSKKRNKCYIIGLIPASYLFGLYYYKNNQLFSSGFYQSFILTLEEIKGIDLNKNSLIYTETWIKFNPLNEQALSQYGLQIEQVSNKGLCVKVLLMIKNMRYKKIIKFKYPSKQFYRYSIKIDDLTKNYNQILHVIKNQFSI